MGDSRGASRQNGQGSLPGCAQGNDVRSTILQKGGEGLALLLEAHDYARALDLDIWDFAVEIDCLREAGLTNSDIRWLVGNLYVEHAREVTAVADASRRFRRIASLTLTSNSCFVLTESGVHFAEMVCGSEPERQRGEPHRAVPHQRVSAAFDSNGSPATQVPIWDAQRRELRVGQQVVKQFKSPAMNQETILTAFEEENWPPRIDDPLPPEPDLDPKRRLHATINSLNGRQKNPLIRFVGDGTGEGVRWELARRAPEAKGQTGIDTGGESTDDQS
jgi:hypothetical protein